MLYSEVIAKLAAENEAAPMQQIMLTVQYDPQGFAAYDNGELLAEESAPKAPVPKIQCQSSGRVVPETYGKVDESDVREPFYCAQCWHNYGEPIAGVVLEPVTCTVTKPVGATFDGNEVALFVTGLEEGGSTRCR